MECVAVEFLSRLPKTSHFRKLKARLNKFRLSIK